ncbi:Uncharacterised protein [uncultured archaeon]|nr:Uncharacterised protein [uncultured archaeon]
MEKKMNISATKNIYIQSLFSVDGNHTGIRDKEG